MGSYKVSEFETPKIEIQPYQTQPYLPKVLLADEKGTQWRQDHPSIQQEAQG